MTLTGPVVPPRSGETRQLVVLLHGWGANGDDLIGLAPSLQPTLPHARFASPDAPDLCDRNPAGRQWYSFTDARPEAMKPGIERARKAIDAYIDAELARLGLDADRLALAGFSQGCMMALHVALRRPEPVAAVVGYSGALIDEENLAAEIASRPPVLLCHGDADPVVPHRSLMDAISGLARHDVPAQWRMSPGVGHGVDPGALEAGAVFLGNAFREARRRRAASLEAGPRV